MIRRTFAAILLLSVVLALLSGCTTPMPIVKEVPVEKTVVVTKEVMVTKEVVVTATPAPTPEPALTIIDGAGRVVTIPKTPERIVSIASAATETLYAIGCGDKIVGVDKYSDYPPEVKDKPQVGSGSKLNVEAVLGLDPDLVVIWWFNKEAIKTLEDKGLTVVAINPKSVDGVMDTIRMLGLITGHLEEAEKLIADMQARINEVTAKVKDIPKEQRPLVYYELTKPMKTTGPGTFTNELIFMAGGINIAADEPVRYPILSQEYIIERNPDVIILISGGASVDEIKGREGWQNIKAVQNDRVYTIDRHLVTSNPRIVEGLEQFARWFHPDLWK
ncbi:MAG TPA: ABC transporter substrate-binding protein [Caldilineae bacterium]|nr:ABC transporter substrate-binding protein [Caldilineae bacterium]